ncbi:MAG TPA: imelysin family protein [Puia sp.]|nr:imelysin family protein [Puia sp.]
MKKLPVLLIIISFITLFSCHKASNPGETVDPATLEQNVINDFTNNVALAQYSNLTSAAVALNGSIAVLTANPTDVNLQAAQASWKAIRKIWEQTEGFLIGPVEAYDYDPNTDTWPTDYTQMDSLLASNNPLQLSDVAALPQSLRGYHPIEYIIFGENGSRKASELDARKQQYLVSLAGDILYNNVQPLYQSWTSAPVNYAQEVMTAGQGSTAYSSRLAFFLDITGDNGMAGICDEVGSGKMKDPFDAKNPDLCESPYSGNTLIDFKDNIIGVQNVYMGLNGGKGMKDLVASKNKNLDNQIQAQIAAAISSFDNITAPYEKAIFDQRVQIQQTMTQLANLKSLLENDLVNFLKQYVKD